MLLDFIITLPAGYYGFFFFFSIAYINIYQTFRSGHSFCGANDEVDRSECLQFRAL